MTKIPLLLILMRLGIGLLMPILSYLHIPHYQSIAIFLFSLGLISDIFDGIIARRLKVSTQRLRRLDSTVDQVFFMLVTLATYLECPEFFHANFKWLMLLISCEVLTYLVCYLKFKKEVATHAISSKIWTRGLFATLIQIIATCHSETLFQVCVYAGVFTRLEIIGILLILKNWTTDVPSLFHALQLRRGKPIKRHTLFNG